MEPAPFGEAFSKDLTPAQDGVAAEAAGDYQERYDPPRKRQISHASPIRLWTRWETFRTLDRHQYLRTHGPQ